jgi:AraC-binding-like domain
MRRTRPHAGFPIPPRICRAVVRVERGTAALNIVLSGVELRGQLAALLGERLKPPLEFAARVSLREGWGRSFARFARLALAELQRPRLILSQPMVAGSFREFVATALLLHQPHNYTEALRRLERPVTPRDVKRAVDYIEANLDAEIGLPEIVATCGVPGRTLIKHFSDFKGTSPMGYLRSARYERAVVLFFANGGVVAPHEAVFEARGPDLDPHQPFDVGDAVPAGHYQPLWKAELWLQRRAVHLRNTGDCRAP